MSFASFLCLYNASIPSPTWPFSTNHVKSHWPQLADKSHLSCWYLLAVLMFSCLPSREKIMLIEPHLCCLLECMGGFLLLLLLLLAVSLPVHCELCIFFPLTICCAELRVQTCMHVCTAFFSFAGVSGSISVWGVGKFFRFCQSFTSNFPFSFPSSSSPFPSLSDLLFALKRNLHIYPISFFFFSSKLVFSFMTGQMTHPCP